MTNLKWHILLTTIFSTFAICANAVPLPGPADIDRVKPEQREPLPVKNDDNVNVIKPEPTTLTEPPKGAEKVKFILKDVKVEGAKAFSQDELKTTYGKYIGTEITLDKVWLIAAEITNRYRENGYFLSRAFVPAQEIGNGNITIKVIEGYVGNIKVEPSSDSHLVQHILADITEQKPLKIQYLERELLLLNDLPGVNYKATLQPLDKSNDGGVELVLNQSDTPLHGSISLDNFGSRYLGPYEASASVEGSIIPFQQTTISGLITKPTDELRSISGSQKIALTPTTNLEFDASHSKAEPGYKLELQNIDSDSTAFGVSITQQLIRQRQENLQIKLGIDDRDTDTDILGTPLTRDRVRAVRLSLNYDTSDMLGGYNYAGLTLSRGIKGLGSSEEGDLNLSRTGVKPDFFKGELTYTRFQNITNDWNALLSFAGQKASDSLFSSEEFGYGGQAFGRAYDLSEISGDDGLAASAELRYQGLPEFGKFNLLPYGFYDIGKVWNRNIDQVDEISGSSAGLGLRIAHNSGASAKIEVALPLTKPQDTPLYGADQKGPRYLFQLGYQF